MKTRIHFYLAISCFSLHSWFALQAQSIEPAEVYSTNLSENMYYKRYNSVNQTIEGVHFMVLADGNNSQKATPPFEVSIYVAPADNISKESITILKTYRLDGIYHMGSMEFKNETIDLGTEVPWVVGQTYRIGLWVNSNEAFEENRDNNAYLFEKPLIYQATSTSAQPASRQAPREDESFEASDSEEEAEPEDD